MQKPFQGRWNFSFCAVPFYSSSRISSFLFLFIGTFSINSITDMLPFLFILSIIISEICFTHQIRNFQIEKNSNIPIILIFVAIFFLF
ncbi:unnamed protein product [Brugia timori]|uniref:Uncharacterized protein n=1 Tax=Brugia timori TaxID=42155 RepID=A0A3P7YC74_9BILA|nr:unnamed protein product [Brugia timori]